MTSKEKIRADDLLVRLNICENRSKALSLIMAGRVYGPTGERVDKGGKTFAPDTVLSLSPGRQFVSRGGTKLAGALEELGIEPKGYNALDLGASTGGFTDCLIKAGAATVTAVDVGRGLIDQSLRNDPRVTLIEGLNAKYLDQVDPATLKAPFDLAVADLSFISLSLILPKIPPFLKPDGRILAMVKPQFEVGRHQVGKGGIVRNPELMEESVNKISALALDFDPPFQETARSHSVLTGKRGNQEFFILFSRVP
ncbi:MAG: TlyA family RNA methyltransferase [Deltaproteobacteria bacterium]|jgi:23S rRNA (cytidine1920-2'-O)/16S rRNA (cytidine1409-2'-O)-methyltransferase|nr:TlyA family RNA methyltransferase [Deltaproteobacteria bacterium]